MSGVGSVGAGGYAALVQRLAAQRAAQSTTTAAGTKSTSVTASQAKFEMPASSGVNGMTGPELGPLGKTEIPAGQGVDRVLSTVKDAQAQADKMVIDLASGRDVNIHNTMVELEKADIALKYTVQLRNRALSAYEELMRMQV